MSQLPDARQMFVEAEGAAADGDFASADELLRKAARIQEAELGPLHPDLASTLNNLAIVAEHLERWDDAETFYRRAATIAAASLPADHPMAAASRQNLEDFCRARELPLDRPAIVPLSEPETPRGPEVSGRGDAADRPPAADEASPDVERSAPTPTPPVVPPAAVASRAPESPPAPLLMEPADAEPPAPVSAAGSRRLPWVALGVAAFLVAVLFATRPWSSGGRPAEPPPTEPAATEASPPSPAPPAAPAPGATRTEPAAAPPPAPAADRPAAVAPRPATSVAEAITLSTAELCRNFSPSGRSWRCDPAGDPVAPGPIVLFTRVKSPADTSIVHRWYRGDRLRQSVTLRIRANPAEGYRTYSRQTVTGPGEWRVQVSSADGRTLHEQRFAVQ